MMSQKLVSELKARHSAAHARLKELTEARRPYALGAVQGDKKARAEIEKLDAEASALASEAATLACAIEEAQRLAGEEEAAEHERLRAQKIAEAREIVADLEIQNQEADRLMSELAQVLDRRQALAGDLQDTRVVYSGVLKALQRRSAIQAAAWFWGLSDHLGIDVPGSASQRQPLAASSVVRADLIGCQETGVIPEEFLVEVAEVEPA